MSSETAQETQPKKLINIDQESVKRLGEAIGEATPVESIVRTTIAIPIIVYIAMVVIMALIVVGVYMLVKSFRGYTPISATNYDYNGYIAARASS